MSKKMWQKIFKTKSVQKNTKINKIDKNKRCSIYEEYQQLNGLGDVQKQTRLNDRKNDIFPIQNLDTDKREATKLNQNTLPHTNTHTNTNTNTTEKSAVDFDERPLPAFVNKQETTPQTQSTFSKVVNSLTLSKRHQQINKTHKTNTVDNGNGNGNGQENENEKGKAKEKENGNDNGNGNISTKTKKKSSATFSSTTTKATTSKNAKTKNKNNKENTMAANAEEDTSVSILLTPCPTCSRTFNTASLSKHIMICEKMLSKKRKPFDSSRQRREGTELAMFLPKNFGLPPSKQTSEPSNEEKPARNSARGSRRGQPSSAIPSADGNTGQNTPLPSAKVNNNGTGTANVAAAATAAAAVGSTPALTAVATVVTSSSKPDRSRRSQVSTPANQKCPHCERFFGLKAYDRHVEWCKEKALQNSIKNPNNEKTKAKERLAARTQYRAPIKTKRSVNREKYAGLTGDENEGDESPKDMVSSMTSDKTVGDNISQSSQDSQKSRVLSSDCDVPLSETSTIIQDKEEGMQLVAIDSGSTIQAVVKSEPKVVAKIKKSASQTFYHHQSVEITEDVPSNLNRDGSYRVLRQFTEPNLRPHSMPFNRTQYFVDDMYPMLNVNNSLYMQQHQRFQQEQDLQMHRSQMNYYPNPFVNFDTNSGQVLTPNMPLKAFSMPYGTTNVVSMSPDMYARMLFPLQPPMTTPLYTADPNPVNWDQIDRSSCDEENCHKARIGLAKESNYKSGLIDSTYDPFLSAKRQLEDLCASHSPPDSDTHMLGYNTAALSTPTTPSAIMPTKMTTSLTLSGSNTLSPSPIIASNHNTHNRKQSIGTPAATITTPTSNFRRTSSLRGPRRSPLLNARPFFAQKRPTIQRGLSDEGPISTNFLKSEEYDEIPVRSVCVNDFAITNSPRVVRRDTSLSNRRTTTGLKLNANDNNENADSISTRGMQSSDERIPANIPKDLSKTDSLAVFLKYEHELEKLNHPGVIKETRNVLPPQQQQQQQHQPKQAENPITSIASNNEALSTQNAATKIASPLFTKELKDKSNNLSKQNSSKSLRPETTEFTEENNKPLKESQSYEQTSTPIQTPLSTSAQSDNLSTRQVRLKPIQQHGGSQLPLLIQPTVTTVSTATNTESPPPQSPQPSQSQPNNPTQLHQQRLLGSASNRSPQQATSSAYDKENKALSSSAEFIDPILINKCDNLPVKLADLKYADSDSSSNDQYSQVRCDRATDPYERYVAPISQLSKLLPLVNKTNANSATTVHMRNAQTQSTPKHTSHQHSHSHPHQQPYAQHTILPRSNPPDNISGRNLLKRKMRLGRNQFLYDTSPEAQELDSSCCSADDETNPRSSAEYDGHHFNDTFDQFIQKQSTPQYHLKEPTTPPNMPNLPIFDNFDFEEFLSSFENDDEDFPLFRDCREFLKNRPTNNKVSNKYSNSSPFDSIGSNYHNQNFFQFPVLTTPTLTPTATTPATHHGNSLKRNPAHIIIPPSNRRLDNKASKRQDPLFLDVSKSDDFHSARSGDSISIPSEGNLKTEQQQNQQPESGSEKHEIFISIETEQNELGGPSSISPNTLRDMVGNSQAFVEVEMDANDNKFSKISDDDNDNNETNQDTKNNNKLSGKQHQLPDVEMNNAKNLKQMVDNNHNEKKISTDPSGDKNKGIRSGNGDSDEMSSIDGYPLASNDSSHHSAGVGSKKSADSAYGSLSRQRATELSGRAMPRSSSHSGPSTAVNSNMVQFQQQQQQQQFLMPHQIQHHLLLQQQQMKYPQAMLKGTRTRHLSGSSSSGSDNSLPPIVVANSYNVQQHQQLLLQQQQQLQQQIQPQHQLQQHHQPQLMQLFQQKVGRRSSPMLPSSIDVVNGNQTSVMASSSTSVGGQANPPPNKPISRFCHECGSKFLVEHAKFCMDCGVKRLMI